MGRHLPAQDERERPHQVSSVCPFPRGSRFGLLGQNLFWARMPDGCDAARANSFFDPGAAVPRASAGALRFPRAPIVDAQELTAVRTVELVGDVERIRK